MVIKYDVYFFSLLGIFLLAIFLRFYNIENFGTFGHDNSRDVILTYKMFKYHEWQYRGPVFSIVWAHLSPIYYYAIFPFYFLLNFHPLAPSIFSSVLNLIALFLIWWTTKEVFGKAPALIAAMIYAVSFLVIKEGAFGLNPCFMPIFSISFLYGIFRKMKGDWKGSLITAVSLAMLISFHPSGFFVLPVAVLIILFLRLRFSKKEILYSGIAFLVLGILPYLYQEKKFNGYDIQKVMEYLGTPKAAGAGLFSYISNFFVILNLNITQTLFYSNALLFLIISTLVLALILYYAYEFFNEKNFLNTLALIIFLYCLVFAIAMKFSKIGMHEAWFQSVLIPWIVVFISVLLSRLNYKRVQVILISLLLLVASQNIYNYFVYKPEDDKFYSQKLVAEKIREDSSGADFDIYGEDTQPFFYLLWFYETRPEIKDKYYSWIKWAKTKNSNLVYFSDTNFELDDNFKKVFLEQHGVSNIEKIFTYNGRNLYRISK